VRIKTGTRSTPRLIRSPDNRIMILRLAGGMRLQRTLSLICDIRQAVWLPTEAACSGTGSPQQRNAPFAARSRSQENLGRF
jgi:hypothetical protein